jgi:hypothetical protein
MSIVPAGAIGCRDAISIRIAARGFSFCYGRKNKSFNRYRRSCIPELLNRICGALEYSRQFFQGLDAGHRVFGFGEDGSEVSQAVSLSFEVEFTDLN